MTPARLHDTTRSTGSAISPATRAASRAVSMKQNVKGHDITARYGGEKFVIALPNTTLRSAITAADHIRRAVMAKELMKRSSGSAA